MDSQSKPLANYLWKPLAFAIAVTAFPLTTHAIDLDDSTMSDVFERIYNNGNPLVPTEDKDGDGLNNLTEFNFGLNPTQYDASPMSQQAISATETRYQFYAPVGLQFRFEDSTGLQTWTLQGSLLTGADDIKVYSVNPAGFDKHFARVRSYGAVADQDGDLLDAWEENELGTNPNLADTDGLDGMDDGYEFTFGLNPLIDDGGLDKDLDGTDNAQDARPDDDTKGPVSFTISAPSQGGTVQ